MRVHLPVNRVTPCCVWYIQTLPIRQYTQLWPNPCEASWLAELLWYHHICHHPIAGLIQIPRNVARVIHRQCPYGKAVETPNIFGIFSYSCSRLYKCDNALWLLKGRHCNALGGVGTMSEQMFVFSDVILMSQFSFHTLLYNFRSFSQCVCVCVCIHVYLQDISTCTDHV